VSAIAGTPVFRMPSIYHQVVTVSAIAGTPVFRITSIYHQVVTVLAIAGTPVFRMPSIYHHIVTVSAIARTPVFRTLTRWIPWRWWCWPPPKHVGIWRTLGSLSVWRVMLEVCRQKNYSVSLSVLQLFFSRRNVRFMKGNIKDVTSVCHGACLFNNAVGHLQ